MDSVIDLIYCYIRGFPIRISVGRRIFAPNHGFSQLITSFVGSQCQGIRLVLFLAWPLCLNLLLELFEIVFLNCFSYPNFSHLLALAVYFFYSVFKVHSWLRQACQKHAVFLHIASWAISYLALHHFWMPYKQFCGPELPTFIVIISFGSVACPERYKRSVATIY